MEIPSELLLLKNYHDYMRMYTTHTSLFKIITNIIVYVFITKITLIYIYKYITVRHTNHDKFSEPNVRKMKWTSV
jgi:hypothetical protein